MRILRGDNQLKRIPVFFVAALATASLFVTVTPRPTHAEGYLVPTVRCLVNTVFLQKCRPAQTPAPETTPAPSQTPAPTQTPPAEQSSNGASSQASPRTYTPVAPVNDAPLDPIELPEGMVTTPEPVKQPTTYYLGNQRIPESEYVAYFNKYSPYAVAGAQQEGMAEVPVARSAEGWKVFGIAWYWWGIVGVAIALFVPSARRGILRKLSALPNR